MITSKISEGKCFYFWEVLLYCDNELANTINLNKRFVQSLFMHVKYAFLQP